VAETYPQIGSNIPSGSAEREWRVTVQWAEGQPTKLYSVAAALDEAEVQERAGNHDVARQLRNAADHAKRGTPL
jgi:predicted negative regulator of RcsB-dependent stress response